MRIKNNLHSLKTTIKLVLFTVKEGNLYIFLPGKNLPSTRIFTSQILDNAAKRLFQELFGSVVTGYYSEQLYTFSSSLSHTIDIVYYFLMPFYMLQQRQKDWIISSTAPKQNTDHHIIQYALQRLAWKIEYTNVVYSLLPKEFTLSELQKTYESILGRILDKRNFRKKILSLGILKLGKHKTSGMKARPAQMYEFKKKKLVMVKVFS